jgi:AbrB family looped-hinge helix DNA binding protein
MQERFTVVTRKGQITIPAEVRKALGIVEGDTVAVSLPEPGAQQVRLRAVRSVAEQTFGIVKPRKRPEDFRELREQFEEEVAEGALKASSVSEA